MTTQTLDAIPVHDPFILAHAPSQMYYMYTAADQDRGMADGYGVSAYTSTDLRNWSGPHRVFDVPEDSWAEPKRAPWAPEVHEYNGRFYLFTTLHQPASAYPLPSDGGGTEILVRQRGDFTYDFTPRRRSCVTAVADSPLGPFRLLDTQASITPEDFIAIDGTLHIDDDGQPWMVYAHEWVQTIDGTFEAIRLSDDLSRSVGEPVHLFRASEGSWLRDLVPSPRSLAPYVTDGCQLYRLASGALTMLWASYTKGPDGSDYIETSATSPGGSLFGPWVQNELLIGGNAGHGMIFDGFDGVRYLVFHRGMNTPVVRAEIVEVADAGDQFRVVRDRPDLYRA